MTLHYRDAGFLKAIPKHLHAQHELCFIVHDQMSHLLQQAEMNRLHHIKIELRDESESEFFSSPSADVFEFFEKFGRTEEKERLVRNHLCIALFSDMLHFIFEFLTCLERRKVTVAYCLLRKPLRENLFYAAWMLAEWESFFYLFTQESVKLSLQRAGANRLAIFKRAVEGLALGGKIDVEELYRAINDKKYPGGLRNIFDKATHLVTTHEGLQNFNFIFKDPMDNNSYESIYPIVYRSLLFALSIQIELFSKMEDIRPSYENSAIMKILTAEEYAFKASASHVSRALSRAFSPFLRCPDCQAGLKQWAADLPGLPIDFIGNFGALCGSEIKSWCHVNH